MVQKNLIIERLKSKIVVLEARLHSKMVEDVGGPSSMISDTDLNEEAFDNPLWSTNPVASGSGLPLMKLPEPILFPQVPLPQVPLDPYASMSHLQEVNVKVEPDELTLHDEPFEETDPPPAKIRKVTKSSMQGKNKSKKVVNVVCMPNVSYLAEDDDEPGPSEEAENVQDDLEDLNDTEDLDESNDQIDLNESNDPNAQKNPDDASDLITYDAPDPLGTVIKEEEVNKNCPTLRLNA